MEKEQKMIEFDHPVYEVINNKVVPTDGDGNEVIYSCFGKKRYCYPIQAMTDKEFTEAKEVWKKRLSTHPKEFNNDFTKYAPNYQFITEGGSNGKEEWRLLRFVHVGRGTWRWQSELICLGQKVECWTDDIWIDKGKPV